MWIVGDVGGEYFALMKLLSRVPKDEKIIFVGDLVDRGPDSDKVVSWVRRSGHTVLMGNHEHMLVDFVDSRNPRIGPMYYQPENYYRNGGIATLKSYLGEDWQNLKMAECEALQSDVAWMRKLPLKIEFEDLIVTHAPMKRGEWSERMESHPTYWTDLIWNRDHIAPNPKKFQIFGHNGVKNIYTKKTIGDEKEVYAICIDDTRAGFISAVHWPSQAIIQEPFTRSFGVQ